MKYLLQYKVRFIALGAVAGLLAFGTATGFTCPGWNECFAKQETSATQTVPPEISPEISDGWEVKMQLMSRR